MTEGHHRHKGRIADRSFGALVEDFVEAQAVFESRMDEHPVVLGWARDYRDAVAREIERRILAPALLTARSGDGLSDEGLTQRLDFLVRWDCSDDAVPTGTLVGLLEGLEARMANGSFSIAQWNLTVLAIARIRRELNRRLGGG